MSLCKDTCAIMLWQSVDDLGSRFSVLTDHGVPNCVDDALESCWPECLKSPGPAQSPVLYWARLVFALVVPAGGSGIFRSSRAQWEGVCPWYLDNRATVALQRGTLYNFSVPSTLNRTERDS